MTKIKINNFIGGSTYRPAARIPTTNNQFSLHVHKHSCTCTFVHCRIMCRWIISFFSPDFFLLTCNSGKHNLNYYFIVLFTLFNFSFIMGLACNKYNLLNMLPVNLKSRLLSINPDLKNYTKLYVHVPWVNIFHPGIF